MTRARRIAIAIAAIVVLFVAYEIVTSFVAFTDDAYVRSDLVAVAPQVSGRIITVNVSDNQTVAEKDLLATIDPVPFELVVAQRRAEVDEAKAQVAADQETITSAQATLSAAVAAATYAHQTHTRVAVLAKAEDAPRAELQKTVDELQRADADVDSAKAEVGRAEANEAMHRAAQDRAAGRVGHRRVATGTHQNALAGGRDDQQSDRAAGRYSADRCGADRYCRCARLANYGQLQAELCGPIQR